MNIRSWLRHSGQIARTEQTRRRRQLGRSSTWRAVIAIVWIGLSIGGGVAAYIVGEALSRGQATLPLGVMQAAAMAGFLMLLFEFVQRTSRLTERLNIDHLLTTVSAFEVVLGVVLAISSRTVIWMSLVAVSVAIGFAVGIQSLASALTIVVAVAGLLALTVLFGICLSFTVELATTRSPRVRRYKSAFAVIGFTFLLIGWSVVSSGLLSVDLAVGWVGAVPTAWFVDLALLGAPAVQSGGFRSVGALGLIVVGSPLLMIITTALATRVWETEPVSAATIHRSRSLVGAGVAEWLFAGRVSRPVLTVARKRWLQERRVPLGLMMTGYLIILLPVVILPAFAAGEVPGISLVVLVYICAAATGLAFGLPLLAFEYQSLPMTLATVPGEQFIRGTVLAGITLGGPITVIGIFGLGIWSPLGILELLLLAITGVLLCVCSVTFAAAFSLRLAYFEFQPVPVPFMNATVYGVVGRREFINFGIVLTLIALICLPAFVSYGAVFFDSSVAMALGLPIVVVRGGSLVLTTVLAVGGSAAVYRRAVQSYNQYTIP